MVIKTNDAHNLIGMSLTIKHPLEEIGETELYISKCLRTNTFMFAIPLHGWNYTKKEGETINLSFAPGPFNHLKYKDELIADMVYAIYHLNQQVSNS